MQQLPRFVVRAAALTVLVLAIAAVPAGAEIVFERSGDIWAMGDDGSNQHKLVDQQSVPGMDLLRQPGIDPGDTALAFVGETLGDCEINCEGIYTLDGGVLRRISGAPHGCAGTNFSCSSSDTHPIVAPDGEVLFEYFNVTGGNSVSKLVRQSMFGGPQTELTPPCNTSNSGGEVQRPTINPANPAQIAFANCIVGGNRAIHVANRDGTGAVARLVDDQPFQDVAFTTGGFLLTNESGGGPGIWVADLSVNPAVSEQMLAEPSGIVFHSPREISGGRVAFVAEDNVWTIPDSCDVATCTYPANATQLTTGGAQNLTWTSQTVAPVSAGAGGPGGGAVVPFVPPPPPPPPVDVTLPVFQGALGLGSATFQAAGRGASIARAAVGTMVRYRLSEAATVTFTIERQLAGRKVGRRCVAQTRANRRRPACPRFVPAGSFVHAGKAGANSFKFSGRVAGRKLAPARYRLVAVAVDAARNRSVAIRVSFRIVLR
ncbi:MAG: hypothetical protein QOE65_2229 [Solirubrobacteraceae bacterium]|nr:hypothetical protein [Solirubrobacteraceae bacterium]